MRGASGGLGIRMKALLLAEIPHLHKVGAWIIRNRLWGHVRTVLTYIYIYIYIYIHTYRYIYIYIYREREIDR